jgi:hypothetical protein
MLLVLVLHFIESSVLLLLPCDFVYGIAGRAVVSRGSWSGFLKWSALGTIKRGRKDARAIDRSFQ